MSANASRNRFAEIHFPRARKRSNLSTLYTHEMKNMHAFINKDAQVLKCVELV